MQEIIFAAIAGTSLMTLFSYAVALLFGQPYKEPLLLAFLLERLQQQRTVWNNIAAWVLHYGIGAFFVTGFHLLQQRGGEMATWPGAVVFGATIGLIGMAGWFCMFRISRQWPAMNYPGYYIQLFVAHLVFAFAVVGVYKLFA